MIFWFYFNFRVISIFNEKIDEVCLIIDLIDDYVYVRLLMCVLDYWYVVCVIGMMVRVLM